MEPEGSLPHPQVSTTYHYPEPHQSIPCPHILFHEYSSDYYFPIYATVFQVVSFHQVPYQNPVYAPLLSPIRATRPSHFILLDLITWILFGEEYRSLNSSLCNFLHSPLTPSLIGPHILLSTLFTNTLILRFFLNSSDQVSHPHKTTGTQFCIF